MSDNKNAPLLPKPSTRKADPKIIGSWKLGKTIGKGSSGRVKLARHLKTGEFAAVKIVSKEALVTSRMSMTGISDHADKILLSIEREIVLMKLIDHPNVLSLYDVWETSNDLYLILEYVPNGELFDYLVARGRLSAQEALQYFQQIISAVDYCHSFNIAHRDLKPENLLLDRENNIKVADFGMAAWEGGAGMLVTSCGSPHYASPEVVEGKTYKGHISDVWSCGVILYALLVGRLPFDDENIRLLLEKVKHGRFVMPADIPVAAQDLLRRMLEKDVEKRITIKQIMTHPWFNSLPPRPVKGSIVPPPTLDTLLRPVTSRSEIDPDILANLRTLWHGSSDSQVIDALLNDEQNWEKTVYHWLLQYRARRLEDYDGDDDHTQSASRARTKPLPAEPVQGPSSSLPTSAVPAQPVLHDVRSRASTVSTRTNHPTGPRTQTKGPPLSIPVAASQPQSTEGPTNSDLQSIRLVSSDQGYQPVTPKIPQESPKLPSIPVIGLGTESMEKCLSQVIDQINFTHSFVPQPTSRPQDTKGPAVQKKNVHDDDESRFADAEDDNSMAGGTSPFSVVAVGTPTTSSGSSKQSSPNGQTFGLGISTQAHRQIIQGQRAPFTSVRDHPLPAPPLLSRQSTQGGPPVSIGRIPKPSNLPISSKLDRSSGSTSDKENSHQGTISSRRRAGTVSQSTFSNSNGGRLERRHTLGDRHVKIVLPGEASVPMRASIPMGASQSSDNSSGYASSASSSTEKTTWFGNLFKFKPATFNLLSVYDGSATRNECTKLLLALGVTVNVEGTGTLTCIFNGANGKGLRTFSGGGDLTVFPDPAGVMAPVKPVRFRIEFHTVTRPHAVAGFTTSIVIIQEKGALSTCKLLYNRLRRDWEFDTPIPILKAPKSTGKVSKST
ncbi:hypothetical protein FRC18_002459 [Serendipita sp. 400]|nr:hypothetical protein FRC18_002459 [Serendipita sp. 400]